MNKPFTMSLAQRTARNCVPSRSFVQRPNEVVRTSSKRSSRQVKLRAVGF
jgi:hypothetical protein